MKLLNVRIMIRFIVILAFIQFFNPVYSQVNTEKFRKEFKESGFYGNVSLAAGLAKGNSEFVKVKSSARIDYAGKIFDSFLVGNYEFQEAKNAKVVNKGFAHLRNIIALSPVFSLELFLQKEFNQFILLEDRNLAGAGLRTGIIELFAEPEDSSLEIYLGTGLLFENEQYDISASPETNLIRSTNYLTLKWIINDIVSFISINYFQFDVEKIHDYRLISDTGLNFLITKNLSFNSSVSYRYDNEPVPDVKNYDLELTNGITFSF
jgi:putative salt-induced outer membrane protein YdiY